MGFMSPGRVFYVVATTTCRSVLTELLSWLKLGVCTPPGRVFSVVATTVFRSVLIELVSWLKLDRGVRAAHVAVCSPRA